jgi:hypothetical protein
MQVLRSYTFVTYLITTLLTFNTYAGIGVEKLKGKAFASTSISESEFNNLLQTVSEAGFQSLLDQSVAKLNQSKKKPRAYTVADLKNMLQVCASFDNENTLGHFMPVRTTLLMSRLSPTKPLMISEVNEHFGTDINKPLVIDYKITKLPGFYSIEIEKIPVVCIKDTNSLEWLSTVGTRRYFQIPDTQRVCRPYAQQDWWRS